MAIVGAEVCVIDSDILGFNKVLMKKLRISDKTLVNFVYIFIILICLISAVFNIATSQTFEPTAAFESKVNSLRESKGMAPIEFTGVNCDSILLSSVEYFTEHLTIKGHADGKYNQWFGWSKCDLPKITDDLMSDSIVTAKISVARYHYDTVDIYEDGSEELVRRDTYYAIVVVWD